MTEEQVIINGKVRVFETGATRDTSDNKPEYCRYLSPLVIEEYGKYMLIHQIQSDGTKRAGDNWQRGIPVDAYMDSMWRHFLAVWAGWWKKEISKEDLCALLFNVQGMLHELVKETK